MWKSTTARSPFWVDDRLLPPGLEAERAATSLTDATNLQGSGCHTTALVYQGRVRFLERHIQRLRRDAGRIQLPPPPADVCRAALMELGRAAFGTGEGVVRLQVSRDAQGQSRLLGTPRPLGDNPATWRAITANETHPGARGAPGAKLNAHPVADRARDAASRAGADEALLLDSGGWLVEGARSCLAVVTAAGRALTPPVARGGVEGLARAIALEVCPELCEGDVSRAALLSAREIVVLNAVRGARPVLHLDESSVGNGEPGPLAAELTKLLAGCE